MLRFQSRRLVSTSCTALPLRGSETQRPSDNILHSVRCLWQRGGAAACALFIAGIFAGLHMADWPIRLSYPGEQILSEGSPLTEIVYLRRGVHIYDRVSSEHFDASIYGPLYYLLGSRLLDPDNPGYRTLRVISILGMLGCAGGCGLLAFWLARSRVAAVLAPLIFLSYAFVHSFGTSVRPDMIALALSMGALLVVYRSQGNRELLLSAMLALLSFFYKSQFVAFPLGILIFLLLEKRRELALRFVGLLAIGGVLLMALFQFVIFRGQAFLDHLLLYNVLPFSWHQMAIGAIFLLLVLLVPLLVGLHYLQQYPNKIILCCLCSASVLGLVMVARTGSDTNYFLESTVLVSTLFAALIGRNIAEATPVGPALLLLVISLFLGQWFAAPPPRQEDFALDRAVQTYLRGHFTPQTPALGYYSGDLLRAGFQLPISDLYHYSQLERQGRISDQGLAAQLRSRRFGVIVLHFDLSTEEDPYWLNYYLTATTREAIRANYQLAAILEMPKPERFRAEDRLYVWVPRT